MKKLNILLVFVSLFLTVSIQKSFCAEDQPPKTLTAIADFSKYVQIADTLRSLLSIPELITLKTNWPLQKFADKVVQNF